MRIEIGEQAFDRGLHQGLVVDRLDVGLFDQAEHRGEGAHVVDIDARLLRRIGRGCRGRGAGLGFIGVGERRAHSESKCDY